MRELAARARRLWSGRPPTAAGRTLRTIALRTTGAFDRLPVRTRLAGVSALLTFIILFSFALVVGSLTVHRIRSDFDREVETTGQQLPSQLNITRNPNSYELRIAPPLKALATPTGSSVIKLLSRSGQVLDESPSGAPALGTPTEHPTEVGGYLVVSHLVDVSGTGATTGIVTGQLIVQYGRALSDLDSTVARVELLLVLGVLAGAAFALLAGIVIARRAMAPIAQLTSTAAEIARTRDSSITLPQPHADDEVGELSRTLQGMLRELDSAHAETEGMLVRQRQFVADASHEMRTPLTSVLANLELLAEALSGEEAEVARSALRSSQRMRRLVADLLLLARTDVGRIVRRERVDLGQAAIEAAAELGPVSASHEISLDVNPVVVDASRDEMLRVILNLLENALRYTPAGTAVRVHTDQERGMARLVVEDDGPGVPERLRETLFERFVRGAGDRGGSFGLGLAIVRAVAESHGGSVALEQTSSRGGARFVVRLPLASGGDAHGSTPAAYATLGARSSDAGGS